MEEGEPGNSAWNSLPQRSNQEIQERLAISMQQLKDGKIDENPAGPLDGRNSRGEVPSALISHLCIPAPSLMAGTEMNERGWRVGS